MDKTRDAINFGIRMLICMLVGKTVLQKCPAVLTRNHISIGSIISAMFTLYRMGEKAPRRWYSILMIVMCIRLVLYASISLRAAPKAVHIAFSQFDAVKNQPIPTDKSIARWLTQIGLYKLNCPKEQAKDWALIVDNSVQIGTQKLLVVLGVRLSKFCGKPLCFEDVEMLVMELHDKSSAEIVCEALEKSQQKVGKAVMVCADDGPDLRGGITCFCAKHGAGRIFDTIHKIGTFLKKIFDNDPEWQAFSTATAEAKRKMQQTPAAHLVPPNQRTKSRFLNIEILVHWREFTSYFHLLTQSFDPQLFIFF